MGVFSRRDFEVTSLVITFFSTIFNGLVLRKLFQITRALKKTRRHSDIGFPEDYGICTCVVRRLESIQLSKTFTLASVTCFFFCALTRVSYRLLFFCLCNGCTVRTSLWFVSVLFTAIGYTLTYAAHFERLKLTFSGTPMELRNWAPKVMYSFCLLYIFMFVGSVAFRFSLPKASGFCLLLAIVIYFTGVSVLTYVFFKKTTAAANTSPPDKLLLEVAVRITVVVTVSALGTAFTALTWVLIFSFCPMCYFWLAVGGVLLVTDQCLCSFCLMCTFSGAVAPYQRVFGRLHNALVGYKSKRIVVLNRMRSATM